MSKKLYFSPSSQPENKYAYGNTNEQEQCNKIALECVRIAKRCGFEAKTNTNSDMYGRTKESNDWGADVHIPIHTNASNSYVQGTRLFCYNKIEKGFKICEAVMKTLAPITPGTSDSITSANFYEIIDTNAYCCYVEIAFHDNVTEAKWIISHTKEIAEAIVKGICNYYDVKYVSESESKPSVKPSTPSNKVDVYYRVKTQAHGWLPEVENLKDFAGHKDSPIIGVAMRVNKGSIKYRVHVKGSGWLGWITGCDIEDYYKGYAGNNKVIDAIQVYYYTPKGMKLKEAVYKVNDFGWQHDTDKDNGQDGYAGLFGTAMTKLRISIKDC